MKQKTLNYGKVMFSETRLVKAVQIVDKFSLNVLNKN